MLDISKIAQEKIAAMEDVEKCGWLRCRLSREEPKKTYFGDVCTGDVEFSFTIHRDSAHPNIWCTTKRRLK